MGSKHWNLTLLFQNRKRETGSEAPFPGEAGSVPTFEHGGNLYIRTTDSEKQDVAETEFECWELRWLPAHLRGPAL